MASHVQKYMAQNTGKSYKLKVYGHGEQRFGGNDSRRDRRRLLHRVARSLSLIDVSVINMCALRRNYCLTDLNNVHDRIARHPLGLLSQSYCNMLQHF